jgi:hypothetical protein
VWRARIRLGDARDPPEGHPDFCQMTQMTLPKFARAGDTFRESRVSVRRAGRSEQQWRRPMATPPTVVSPPAMPRIWTFRGIWRFDCESIGRQ